MKVTLFIISCVGPVKLLSLSGLESASVEGSQDNNTHLRTGGESIGESWEAEKRGPHLPNLLPGHGSTEGAAAACNSCIHLGRVGSGSASDPASCQCSLGSRQCAGATATRVGEPEGVPGSWHQSHCCACVE